MMPNKKGPCYGCTERFPACSGNCPKDLRGEYGYKAWMADIRKEKAAEKEYYLRRREDWNRSEECEYGRSQFGSHKNRQRGVRVNGRK